VGAASGESVDQSSGGKASSASTVVKAAIAALLPVENPNYYAIVATAAAPSHSVCFLEGAAICWTTWLGRLRASGEVATQTIIACRDCTSTLRVAALAPL